MIQKLFNLFSSEPSAQVGWHHLTEKGQVDALIRQSRQHPQLIYKHSHACATCWFARREIERVGEQMKGMADLHFIDVLDHRAVSNYIAQRMDVRHESPQAILVKSGEAVQNISHSGIKGDRLIEWLG